MITMTTPRVTMRLEPELKTWLETEAKRQDRSVAYVAKEAIRSLKDRTEAKAKIVQEAVVEADKGVFISEERMGAWLDSWNTDDELPSPEPDIFRHPS
jgi:predicted transcriptional regulator